MDVVMSSANASLTKQTFSLPNGDRFDCWILIVQPENCPAEFWFKALDVATFLDYKNPHQALKDNVREEWKKKWCELLTLRATEGLEVPANWHPHTVFINESGLYALVNRSRKPEALRFQDWVNGEVLPSLRRDGMYVMRRMEEAQRQQFELLREQMTLVLREEITQLQQDHMNSMRQLIDSNNQMIQGVVREAAEMEKRVAQMTDSDETRHTFSVYRRKLGSFEYASMRDYVVLRCQKRKLPEAIKTINMATHELVLYKQNVPNSINVLAKSKEVLRRENIPYSSRDNRIRTTVAFERVAAELLCGECKFTRVLLSLQG